MGARYTIRLRTLIATDYDFGLDNFPVWDAAYRPVLVNKFLEKYRNEEIGFEVPELFREEINYTFNDIMPYFVQLYNTTIHEINPLLDFSRIEESTRKNDQSGVVDSTVEDTQNTKLKSVSSDTPQNLLAAGSIEGNTWASNANFTDNTSGGNNKANTRNQINSTDDYIMKTYGFNTNPIASIVAIRDAIVNIDKEIIEHPQLAACFMGVF